MASLLIMVAFLATGVISTFASINRLSYPPNIHLIWAVAIAAVVGFVGNEAVALFRIVLESGKSVLTRLLNSVEEVMEIRVRWLGHLLLAEVNIAVSRDLSVETGRELA